MTQKKRPWIIEKIYGIAKKSTFLCKVYEFFNPELARLCKYGKIDPSQYVINHDKRLVYIAVPKVATSSIKVAMCEENMEQVDSYNQIHHQVKISRELEDEEKNYYKFSFVRNPYERLVSCYVNKYITDRQYLGKTRKDLYMDHYLFGIIRNVKDFTDFVKKIRWIPICLEDRHFQQQYSLLYKHGKCMADYIGRYENIQEAFEVLREKFDLRPLLHYNKTDKGNWMDYYTMETAKIVYKKYKKDLKAFGYMDTYHELIQYLKEKEKAKA